MSKRFYVKKKRVKKSAIIPRAKLYNLLESKLYFGKLLQSHTTQSKISFAMASVAGVIAIPEEYSKFALHTSHQSFYPKCVTTMILAHLFQNGNSSSHEVSSIERTFPVIYQNKT